LALENRLSTLGNLCDSIFQTFKYSNLDGSVSGGRRETVATTLHFQQVTNETAPQPSLRCLANHVLLAKSSQHHPAKSWKMGNMASGSKIRPQHPTLEGGIESSLFFLPFGV
jgi:hypothetical protein